jgi:hypothetical protein
MTNEQLEVLRKVDEMLNDVCMPTYSKLVALIRDDADLSEYRLKKFREAVSIGNYTVGETSCPK